MENDVCTGIADLFEINRLCRFYVDQYKMVFDIVFDPVFCTLKGKITFKSTTRNFTIFCALRTENEITQDFHTLIFDVLAEEANKHA